jgi:hypothetical protein
MDAEFVSGTLAPLRYRGEYVRSLERALAAALGRCQRDSKEKCRFAFASEKPDVLNSEMSRNPNIKRKGTVK